MGRQLLVWFLAAGLGGCALWLAGSYWQYGGLPPGLIERVMGSHAGRAVTSEVLQAMAPAAPAGVKVLGIGDLIPADFMLPDPSGKPQALAQWRGKRVLINFWATWCAPCRKEMPALMAAQAKYGSEHVRIVGIAIDDPAAVRAFLAKSPLNYPVLIGDPADPKEKTDPTTFFGDTRGVLPYSVLIDANGRVAETHLGVLDAERLRQWLQ